RKKVGKREGVNEEQVVVVIDRVPDHQTAKRRAMFRPKAPSNGIDLSRRDADPGLEVLVDPEVDAGDHPEAIGIERIVEIEKENLHRPDDQKKLLKRKC